MPLRPQEDEWRLDRERHEEEADYSEASSRTKVVSAARWKMPVSPSSADASDIPVFARNIAEVGRTAREVSGDGTPTVGAGCQAFTAGLQEVVWPPRFKSDLPPLYNGTTNPIEFLQLYTIGILAADGQADLMVNYIPMALKGSARSWLVNLPRALLCHGMNCVNNSSPTSEEPLAGRGLPLTKVLCGKRRGRHCASSSNVSSRFKTASPASTMRRWSQLSATWSRTPGCARK